MDGIYEDLRNEERRQMARLVAPKIERLLNIERIDWESKFPQKQKTLRGRTIQKIAISNGTLIIAVSSCSILRWKLAGKDFDEVDIPCKADDIVEQLFLDSSANHLLIGMKSGDVYYLHSKGNKPKKLSKFQGNLESVAFDLNQSSEASTKSFLAGTSTGFIYEISLDASGKEKVFQIIYQLDMPIAVTAMHFETFSEAEFRLSANSSSSSSTTAAVAAMDTRHLVLFATTAPTRLYHIVGGATLQSVFTEAKERGELPYTELPGDLQRAELHAYPIGNPLRSKSFALMTAAGIYYGPMSGFASSGADSNMEAHIMPFPQSVSNYLPLSFSTCEFHFLVLSNDALQVISSLNGDLVEEEAMMATDGTPIGIVGDATRVANLMYTSNSIFQVSLVNEDRNVWKTFLDKAVASGEDSVFDMATLYAKTLDQKRLVHRTRAEFYYTANALDKAATYFAKSGLQFEEVTMRLLVDWKGQWQQQTSSSSSSSVTMTASQSISSANNTQSNTSNNSNSNSNAALTLTWWKEVDAATPLRIYVSEILKLLPTHMKSQKTMLAIWLVEIYLHQIAAAENYEAIGLYSNTSSSNSSSSNHAPVLRKEDITNDFQRFLRDFRNHLDYPTVISLITARNQRSLLLYFTRISGDYHRVVSILLTSQKYGEALSLLMDAPTEKIELFIYKIAPLLMEHEPERTIDMLLRKNHLSFASLLPMIMHYTTKLDGKVAAYQNKTHHTNKASGANKRRDGDADSAETEEDVAHVEDNYAIRYLEQWLEKCGISLSNTTTTAAADSNNGVDDPPDAAADELQGIDLDVWGACTIEPVLLHTFIWLLAKYDPSNQETKLIRLLTRLHQLRSMNFLDDIVTLDPEYILRMCRLFQRKKSSIHALLLLHHPMAAVKEALTLHDVPLAREIARKETANEELQRKLWLEIAMYAIAHAEDMKQAIHVLAESNGVLQIEDLLPLLPDFTEIDLFKTEICASLESSSTRIQLVREDMTRLAQSVDHTVQELEAMKNRCYSLSSNYQRCETCHDILLGKTFYLFPCSHGFHCDCLVAAAPKLLSPGQYASFQILHDALKTLTTGRGKEFDSRTRVQVEQLQAEIDNYVAADCPLCGYAMIAGLSTPLIDEEAAQEAKTWDLA